MDHLRSTKIWVVLFLLPTFIIYVAFYLGPVVTVIATSFTDWYRFDRPTFVGLDNYIQLFTWDNRFVLSLRNMALWALIRATIHVGFGVVVAFVLHRKPVGHRFVLTIFMVPNIISIAAWAVMYRFMFHSEIGIVNNALQWLISEDFYVRWLFEMPYAFIVVAVINLFYSVITCLLVLNGLNAIPQEVHEASLLDGATPWQQTWLIRLPLIRNAVGTAVILALWSQVTMFEAIELTTRGGPGNETYHLSLMLVRGLINQQYGYTNAVATIMLIMGVIIMLTVHRSFRMDEKYY